MGLDKQCKRCLEVKPVQLFFKSFKSADGLKDVCRVCNGFKRAEVRVQCEVCFRDLSWSIKSRKKCFSCKSAMRRAYTLKWKLDMKLQDRILEFLKLVEWITFDKIYLKAWEKGFKKKQVRNALHKLVEQNLVQYRKNADGFIEYSFNRGTVSTEDVGVQATLL